MTMGGSSSIWKQRFKNLLTGDDKRGRIIDCVFLTLIAIYGLYILRAMFAPGYFYAYDLNQHFVESNYVATVLLPQYHQLIGWNPYYYLGWPQGQFNPPAAYLVYSLVYYAISWVFTPLTIFKIMIGSFFILQGFAIYFAARGFGLNRLSAFVAGLITIGTSGGFETGGALSSMYYGMYEFSLAVALIPLTLAIFHQSFQKRSRFLTLLTAVLLAFDFLLHTLAGTFLMLVLVIYTVAQLFRIGWFGKDRQRNMPKAVLKFLVVILIALGICSFWIIPAYSNRSFYSSQGSLVTELGGYKSVYSEWHAGFIFGEQTSLVTSGFQFLLHPTNSPKLYYANVLANANLSGTFYQFLLGLAVVGAAFSLTRSNSRFPVLVILGLMAIFVFVSLGPNYYNALWHDPTFHMVDLRPARAAAPVRVFLAILGGAGLGEAYWVVNKVSLKIAPPKLSLVFKIMALMVIAFLGFTLFLNSFALMNELPIGRTVNYLGPDGSASSMQVLSWVKQNVPNTTRVAYQEYPGPNQHLFAIAPLETGVQEVGSNYGFWWPGADATNALPGILGKGKQSGSALYSTFAGLNTGYVVVWGKNAQSNLSSDPSYFTLVDRAGPFEIFQLNNFAPSYVSIQNGTGGASVLSFTPEQITIHVQNVSRGSTLLVRMSYYSNWFAYASNGNQQLPVQCETVKLPLLSVNYTSVRISSGGSYNITLDYGQTKVDKISNDISSFTLIVFLFGSILSALEARTRFPIAEYLATVARRTSAIVRSATIVNAARGAAKRGRVGSSSGSCNFEAQVSRDDNDWDY